MNETLQKLADAINAKVAEAEAMLNGDPTPEQTKAAEALIEEAGELKSQYERLEKAAGLKAGLRTWLSQPTTEPPAPETQAENKGDGQTLTHIKAKGFALHSDYAFADDDRGTRAQKAYAFGRWVVGALNGAKGPEADWARDNGLPFYADTGRKAMSEGVGTAGGYLVPDVFVPDLIRLVESYGVARQIMRVMPMARDRVMIPRRTGGVTATYVAEGVAPTASTPTVDLVGVDAVKMIVTTYYSSELAEDSAIDIGNLIATEIAQEFARQEDLAVFNGDGTATYGGHVGFVQKIKDAVAAAGGTWTTDAHKLYLPGVANASGNAFSEITLADFAPMVGNLIGSVNDANLAWVCSRVFYWTVMHKLALAAGGAQGAEIVNGVRRNMFMGYPVYFSAALPSTDSNSQIACLFGDFNQAAKFGDRRSLTLAQSEHYLFTSDQIAVRGTERYGFTVHDVGTASSTASSRVAGPISALAMLNS